MDSGTYIEIDGRPAVRFQRTYAHPVERLWAAITEPAELAHWFPSGVRIEPHAGGKIIFSGDSNIEDQEGKILAFDPPRRLAYTWGESELHFELATDGEGSTLTLIDVLEARNTAARNAAGWHVCLAELGKHIRDETAAGPHSDTAEAWKPLYDAYVAEGLPSGAAIPGVDSAGGAEKLNG